MFVLRGVEPLILENNIFVFDLIAKTLLYMICFPGFQLVHFPPKHYRFSLYMIKKLKIIVSQS